MKKILWAIDPFDAWPKQTRPMAEVLRDLTGGRDVAIHPVSFFSREEASWFQYQSGCADGSFTVKDFGSCLERYLGELELPGLREARVIAEERVTPASFHRALLEFAALEHADGMALSTHGRTGPERWNHGSFAETLLRHSPVPVLVLNPDLSSDRKLGTILIPTDFSDASRIAFEQAVQIASSRGVPVVLLHETNTYDSEAVDPAAAWSEWAATRGVTVRTRLESLPTGHAQSIVDCARAVEAGLIVMATQAGPVRAALGGSIARAVVRTADCPVLVWRPDV